MGPVTVMVQRFVSGDGTILEADVLTPETPVANAVVCHPHPLYGGSRNDGVVAALCHTFIEADHFFQALYGRVSELTIDLLVG